MNKIVVVFMGKRCKIYEIPREGENIQGDNIYSLFIDGKHIEFQCFPDCNTPESSMEASRIVAHRFGKIMKEHGIGPSSYGIADGEYIDSKSLKRIPCAPLFFDGGNSALIETLEEILRK